MYNQTWRCDLPTVMPFILKNIPVPPFPFAQPLRYCCVVMPVMRLKYLLKNDGLGKFIS